jgi:prevent-host-death family protein
MSQTVVGVRELRARLSRYLRLVKTGQVVEVTERGRSIGRIVPVGLSLEETMRALCEAGLVRWSGRRLKDRAPVARARGKRTVAELLVEDRG